MIQQVAHLVPMWHYLPKTDHSRCRLPCLEDPDKKNRQDTLCVSQEPTTSAHQRHVAPSELYDMLTSGRRKAWKDMGTGQGGPGCQVGVIEKEARSQDLKEEGGKPCRCQGQSFSTQGGEPVRREQEPRGAEGLQRPRAGGPGGRPCSMTKMCLPSQGPWRKGRHDSTQV